MINDGDIGSHPAALFAVATHVAWLPPSEYFFYESEK